MAELARRIEKKLEKLGYPREGRRFQAHLTIGRIRHGGPELAGLAGALDGMADVAVGAMRVEEVVVFSSQLLPTGPLYTAMARAALGADNT
jgi:2'-5' RNA ligase